MKMKVVIYICLSIALKSWALGVHYNNTCPDNYVAVQFNLNDLGKLQGTALCNRIMNPTRYHLSAQETLYLDSVRDFAGLICQKPTPEEMGVLFVETTLLQTCIAKSCGLPSGASCAACGRHPDMCAEAFSDHKIDD